MRLLQYLILSILVLNGSLPLIKNVIVDHIESEVIKDFLGEIIDCNSDSTENESEGASDNDLATPENHCYHEPKPNESNTTPGQIIAKTTAQKLPYHFVEKKQLIAEVHTYSHIDPTLAEWLLFSKNKRDLSS